LQAESDRDGKHALCVLEGVSMLTIPQYWGWVKYSYREEPKARFADAKTATIKWLDVCPVEVIWRFVNRSWQFMDAYRKGLTGVAAAWVVQKQKGHRAVSESAMQAFEALLQAGNSD
jgi:hypothetical protein